MTVKNKKVIFRVTEEFFDFHISRLRKEGGFTNTSVFMREMLEQLSDGQEVVISPADKRDIHDLCVGIERLNVNFEETVLRTYDLENAPDGQEFHKLSEQANRFLKSIKKKKIN